MKFLCVKCDEPMVFQKVEGPESDGSLSVLYHCNKCGSEMAMLTNALETQMVRSLGVKVGGRTVPAAPMEHTRESLITQEGKVPPHPTLPLQGGRQEGTGRQPAGHDSAESPGGCPFPAMIPEFPANAKDITWTPDAQARLDRIPEMVRPMVKQALEEYARDEGKTTITPDLIDIAKEILGAYYKR